MHKSTAEEANLAAAETAETPFVKNRKSFGYPVIEVKPANTTEPIIYGNPPQIREVPTSASIVARRK